MNLTEEFRAAAADPPPTSIDLDRLMAAARRHAVRTRWLAGAGGAAALVVLTAATASALVPSTLEPGAGSGPGVVTLTPGPAGRVPTEQREVAEQRLTAALRTALAPDIDRSEVSVTGDPASGYQAAVGGGLHVFILPRLVPLETVCLKNDATTHCTLERLPSGGVEYRLRSPQIRQAESYRPDGTLVMVSLMDSDRYSLDRLMTIARAPALTLFP